MCTFLCAFWPKPVRICALFWKILMCAFLCAFWPKYVRIWVQNYWSLCWSHCICFVLWSDIQTFTKMSIVLNLNNAQFLFFCDDNDKFHLCIEFLACLLKKRTLMESENMAERSNSLDQTDEALNVEVIQQFCNWKWFCCQLKTLWLLSHSSRQVSFSKEKKNLWRTFEICTHKSFPESKYKMIKVSTNYLRWNSWWNTIKIIFLMCIVFVRKSFSLLETFRYKNDVSANVFGLYKKTVNDSNYSITNVLIFQFSSWFWFFYYSYNSNFPAFCFVPWSQTASPLFLLRSRRE